MGAAAWGFNLAQICSCNVLHGLNAHPLSDKGVLIGLLYESSLKINTPHGDTTDTFPLL